MNNSINLFDLKVKQNYKTEILAGITIALLFIPESLAIAGITGIPPLTLLYSSAFFLFITAIIGGRPGMISSVPLVAAILAGTITKKYGVDYVFATFVFAGFLQIVGVFLKLDKIVYYISKPVIFGFFLSLVIPILIKQIIQPKDNYGNWLIGSSLYLFLGLVGLSVLIIMGLPKLNQKIPVYLGAIFIIFGIVNFLKLESKTVGDLFPKSTEYIPFQKPAISFNTETLKIIFPYALFFAILASVESLLKLKIIDNITESTGNSKRELFAQGTANILSGLFFGMGGFATTTQTLTNISIGSRARFSGIVAAIILVAFIYFGFNFILKLPLAPFIAILLVVTLGSIEWVIRESIAKFGKSGTFVTILTTVLALALHYSA